MPIPKILTSLFSSGAKDIVDSVGNVIDNLTLSKEEKENLKAQLLAETNKHLQIMQGLAQQETEAFLKDNDSARTREVTIATAVSAPLINKIISPLLAVIIVASTLLIWALILFRHYEPKTSESMIIGALSAIASQVISYYFGSSSSSAKKSDQIEALLKP